MPIDQVARRGRDEERQDAQQSHRFPRGPDQTKIRLHAGERHQEHQAERAERIHEGVELRRRVRRRLCLLARRAEEAQPFRQHRHQVESEQAVRPDEHPHHQQGDHVRDMVFAEQKRENRHQCGQCDEKDQEGGVVHGVPVLLGIQAAEEKCVSCRSRTIPSSTPFFKTACPEKREKNIGGCGTGIRIRRTPHSGAASERRRNGNPEALRRKEKAGIFHVFLRNSPRATSRLNRRCRGAKIAPVRGHRCGNTKEWPGLRTVLPVLLQVKQCCPGGFFASGVKKCFFFIKRLDNVIRKAYCIASKNRFRRSLSDNNRMLSQK